MNAPVCDDAGSLLGGRRSVRAAEPPFALGPTMTDAQLLSSLEVHGLTPSSVDYDLDRRVVRVMLHGLEGLWLERGVAGWRVTSAGCTLGPTLVWDRAEALREQSRRLDGLLGVLEDLGQRHPGDHEVDP